MGYGDNRTHVRHPAPIDVSEQPNGQNASSLQVVAYSAVAGALVLGISHTIENGFLAKYDAARMLILAAVAVLIGGTAGAFCDPLVNALRRRLGRRF
jgi:hypothetical protein